MSNTLLNLAAIPGLPLLCSAYTGCSTYSKGDPSYLFYTLISALGYNTLAYGVKEYAAPFFGSLSTTAKVGVGVGALCASAMYSAATEKFFTDRSYGSMLRGKDIVSPLIQTGCMMAVMGLATYAGMSR